MSFGFPAYHEHTELFNLTADRLHGLVRSAFEELGWKINADTHSYLQASVSFNFWSWGEKITVSIEGSLVTVISKGVMPTQCVDWGKNKQNVMTLLSTLKKLERSENEKLSYASVNDGISPLSRLLAENDQ